MDNIIVRQKLDALARCINRIGEKCPENLEELLNSYDLQDIISINLERAIQQSVDAAMIILSDLDKPVPSTMAEAFIELREGNIISAETEKNMIKAVGFRNVAVHAYKKIDWAIVWSIITKHIQDFKNYAQEIINSGY